MTTLLKSIRESKTPGGGEKQMNTKSYNLPPRAETQEQKPPQNKHGAEKPQP